MNQLRPWLDHNAIYHALLLKKEAKQWHNITISPEDIADLMDKDDWYELTLPYEEETLDSYAKIQHGQNIVIELLARYIEATWKYNRRKWESNNAKIVNFTNEDSITEYEIRVDKKEAQLINDIKTLIQQFPQTETYCREHNIGALNVKRHAYQPLLYTNAKLPDNIKVMPVLLNEGESNFVETLRTLCQSNSAIPNTDIYLIRNLSRGRGVSLFSDYNFYPDFILWMIHNDKQHILFIDPKGLVHIDERKRKKIEMHSEIKCIEKHLQKQHPGVFLHSYIWSVTARAEISSLQDLTDNDYHRRGIYFATVNGEMREMLRRALNNTK